MILILFAYFTVAQCDAYMPRELSWIRIVGINHVPNFLGKRSNRRIAYYRFFEFVHAGAAIQHSDRDYIGNAELRGIAVGRITFGRQGFPQPMHDSLRGSAFYCNDLLGPHARGAVSY